MIPTCADAQKSASLSSVPPAAIEGPIRTSKTELVNRFRDIKTRYAAIRTTAEKYTTLETDAPSQVKVLRLKIDAAMRSYEYYEFRTQRQRDQLNRLVRLEDTESVRLQMAMDRLSKM